MSLTLRHNLTSDYLDAARRLSPQKQRRGGTIVCRGDGRTK